MKQVPVCTLPWHEPQCMKCIVPYTIVCRIDVRSQVWSNKQTHVHVVTERWHKGHILLCHKKTRKIMPCRWWTAFIRDKLTCTYLQIGLPWMSDNVVNKASNTSECHIVLSVTATVTISTTGKNAPCCQCYDGSICPEVNSYSRAPNTH